MIFCRERLGPSWGLVVLLLLSVSLSSGSTSFGVSKMSWSDTKSSETVNLEVFLVLFNFLVFVSYSSSSCLFMQNQCSSDYPILLGVMWTNFTCVIEHRKREKIHKWIHVWFRQPLFSSTSYANKLHMYCAIHSRTANWIPVKVFILKFLHVFIPSTSTQHQRIT